MRSAKTSSGGAPNTICRKPATAPTCWLGWPSRWANIDEVIALIRGAKDPVEARTGLMERDWPAEDVSSLIALIDDPNHMVVDGRYRLSEAQARANP